eukprot:13928916-Alexandrium_andersonii.AAC.1
MAAWRSGAACVEPSLRCQTTHCDNSWLGERGALWSAVYTPHHTPYRSRIHHCVHGPWKCMR